MTLQRILLAIVLIEIPLQIDVYLGHDKSQAAFGAISGFNVSLTTFCLVALFAMWLPAYVQQSAFPGRTAFATSVPLMIYIACSGVSIITAYDRSLSAHGLFLICQAFLVFIYIANTTRTREDLYFIAMFLVCGLMFQGLLMAYTRYVGSEVTLTRHITSRIDSANMRVGGTIGSPITAASYLGLMLPTTAGVLIACKSGRWKTIAAIAFLAGMLGLIVTLSRGAWIGVSLATTALVLLSWKRGLISARFPLALSIAVGILIVAMGPMILSRISSDDRGSAHARLPLMKIAGHLIADHPVLGVGINNCQRAAQRYRGMAEFREEWFYTVHNKYLLILAEVGLIGLIAYLAFLVSTIRVGWRCWKRLDAQIAPIALGITLAIAGQMIHMMVDVFNSRPQVQMLWLSAGLIAAIARMGFQTAPDPHQQPAATTAHEPQFV